MRQSRSIAIVGRSVSGTAAIAGWGSAAFTAHEYYFLVPTFAPLIGGVLGGAVYRGMIHTEHGRGKAHAHRRLSGNINDDNDEDDGGALLATHPPSHPPSSVPRTFLRD